MKTYIAYTRVSTAKQGLGIEAQQSIIEQFAANEGASIEAWFSEKESGKEYISHRIELQRALAMCKEMGATLIVAKVDRLTRDLEDGAHICKNYSVEFCDHPHMTSLEQGIFFGMAQQERQFISQRTKQALQALKEKGVKLGRPGATWTMEQTMNSAKVRHEAALDNIANRRAYAFAIKCRGSLRSIAAELNGAGFRTSRGKLYVAKTVRDLIRLYQTM